MAAVIGDLPAYVPDIDGNKGRNAEFLDLLETITAARRVGAVPGLLHWTNDVHPDVRSFALGIIGIIYIAYPPASGFAQRPSLPVEFVPIIAPQVLDMDGDVREKAAVALRSATYTDAGHAAVTTTASERVSDEALTQVFDKHAMSVFLLQYLNRLRLTPDDLATQKLRLVALSTDETVTPALRHAAAPVARCVDGRTNLSCMPDAQDFHDDANPSRSAQHR